MHFSSGLLKAMIVLTCPNDMRYHGGEIAVITGPHASYLGAGKVFIVAPRPNILINEDYIIRG